MNLIAVIVLNEFLIFKPKGVGLKNIRCVFGKFTAEIPIQREISNHYIVQIQRQNG